jgi:serine/threonine protein phosphatase PrpC
MTEHTHELQQAVATRPLEIEAFYPLSSVGMLDIEGRSVQGKLHSHNTDHFLAVKIGRVQETLISSLAPADLPPRFEEYAYSILVADGRGRRGAGARASRVALSTLAHLAIRYGKWHVRVDPETSEDIKQQIDFFSRQVHEALYKAHLGDSEPTDLATSLTAVYVAGTDLFAMGIGTSSTLLFRDDHLVRLAIDRSSHQWLGAAHERTPEGATPLRRNGAVEITSGQPDGPVSIEQVPLASGDRLVLCTNGLTDFVKEREIAEALTSRRHPREQCEELVDLALAAGSSDDITVVVADYRLCTRPT